MAEKRKAAMKVRDLINAIHEDDSDLEDLYESSGDEYVVNSSIEDSSSSESSSEDEPLSKVKLKVQAMKDREQTSASSTSSRADSSDDDGFKLWGRAGASGILYDFDVYQGASMGKRSADSLGVGGDVVMKLVSTLEDGQNYKLFADNYFTSLPLVRALAQKSIWYVGTVRANRLKGCELKAEKELKREGRGSVDIQIDRTSNIVALRWFDNKAVDVVSSFVGAEPMGEVRRWDKSSRQYIFIPRPKIIEIYNSFMGGVDLLDSLTSLYKQKMKSRRWYMYIFWHTLLVAVVNAWLFTV